MKNISCLIGTGLFIMAGCNRAEGPRNQPDHQDSTGIEVVQQNRTDTLADTLLIVPGKQAGKLYLGQDMQEVSRLLGKPDQGDAAMGNAMGVWYKESNPGVVDTVRVFSSYRDSTMSAKDVKQISVSSGSYETKTGLHTGMALSEVMKVYPDLKLVQRFKQEKGQAELLVYAREGEGIAFDLLDGKCVAITIYPAAKTVNQLYLPARPGWKTAP